MKKKFDNNGVTRFTSYLKMSSCLIVFLITSIVGSYAQSSIATGIILDENNAPMIGVTIMVDGTNDGTSTGLDGEYTLANVKKGAKLIYSYVGYKSQERIYDGKAIQVKMAVDQLTVEEVVVVGFGSQKKANLTGAVAVAGSEVFESRPVNSATQALQGAVPGLTISNSNGSLTSDASINIRSIGTIGEGSSGAPLVLIDGMEGDLNSINPQDIESVSVLKDAASASIYGSRAPFGVILVTTKKGKKGKMSVNYNNSFRVSTMLNLCDGMDSENYAYYINDGLINYGKVGSFTEENIDLIKQYKAGLIASTIPDPKNPTYWKLSQNHGNTDWYDAMFKDQVFGQEHNISIGGGNEQHQIYASINYLSQEGFMAYGGDASNRFSSSLRATGEISKIFKYNYSFKYQRNYMYQPSELNEEDHQGKNWYSFLSRYGEPNRPELDANGFLFGQLSMARPIEQGGRYKRTTSNQYQQLSIVATPIDDWNITTEMNFRTTGVRKHTDYQFQYRYDIYGEPYYIYNPSDSSTSIVEQTDDTMLLNPSIYTDYTFSLNDDHNFKTLLGFQSEHSNSDYFYAKQYGLYVDDMEVIDVTSGTDALGNTVPAEVKGNTNMWSTVGFFGRLNYDYKGRYLLEANLRYDGTSRYRRDMRWKLFPSVSAGWNIAQENFWSGLKDKVGMFKLRASYGVLGNQNTKNLYPTYSNMTLKVAASNWLVNGAKPNTASAPALLNSFMTWERIETTNIGFDIGALNNRLTGSFEVYQRNTLDMIGPATTMPAILGTEVPKSNNTDLRTRGWELSVRWNDVRPSGFGYSAALMLTDAKTKITRYPNESGQLKFSTTAAMNKLGGCPINFYEGQTYGEIWGYETIDIARSQEQMDKHLASLPNGGQDPMSNGGAWKAGDIMWRDRNGDGIVGPGSMTTEDHGDMKIIGNEEPRYEFGLNLAANYKGFDVSMFFQGVLKRDFYTPYASFWGSSTSSSFRCAQNEHLDYFRPVDTTSPLGANVDAYYPRIITGDVKNNAAQTGFLQNAAYIRLKNLQVGYTFNKSVVSKIGLSNLRIFASGENLWTGTKLSTIFDPETCYGGWAGIGYPLQVVYSMGLSASF